MIAQRVIQAVAVLGACSLPAWAADATVLGPQASWRYYITAKPDSPDAKPLLPAGEWAMPEFADGGWAAQAAPVPGRRQMNAELICLRGRFMAEGDGKGDGAKLLLAYRGGAVVYLNGTEIARGDMPAGKLQALAPATAYPRRVFVTPDGEALLRDYGAKAPPPELADRYEARVRKLGAALPGKLIRKGVNVLAVELHAAPIPADLPPVGRVAWDTVALESASLTAPAGSGLAGEAAATSPGAKGGLVVWSASPLERWGHEIKAVPPAGKPAAARAVTGVGGIAAVQIFVAGAGEKLDVAVEGLPGKVQVRYGRGGGEYVGLFDRPEPGAPVQAVWLTLTGWAPGKFSGVARVTAATGTAEAPIELTVLPFQVPPPRQQRVWVNCLQSAESVARYYNVPMWSDRHFELIEPSMALMGLIGNDILGVSAVSRSVFGDDPVIVFRKEGGGHVPELKHLRRYLATYGKHAGAPAYLVVHVWNYGMYYKGGGRDGGTTKFEVKTFAVKELRGTELVDANVPMYGQPGSEEQWKPLFEQMRALLAEMKWKDTRLLLGTSGDTWPSDQTAAFFGKVAPGVGWRSLTHGVGSPKWGASVAKRTQPNGMVIDLLEMARRVPKFYTGSEELPVCTNSRDNVGSNPGSYLCLAGDSIVGFGYEGYCWKGIDYWPYKTETGALRSALNSYVGFGNMVGGTPRAMAVPGPAGAVATQQFEVLREATQQCEAALAIRRGLHRLLDPVTRPIDLAELFVDKAVFPRRDGKPLGGEPKFCELELSIWEDGDKCEVLVAAPTLNGSKDHSGTIKVVPAQRGKAYEVAVSMKKDGWGTEGGEGKYTIRLEHKGDGIVGTYEGTFEGVPRSGAVKGTLLKGAYDLAVSPAAPRTELTDRAEQALSNYVAAANGATRRGTSYDDVYRAVEAVYASAGEVQKAAAKKNGEAAGVAGK
jgi:hypothetical protein